MGKGKDQKKDFLGVLEVPKELISEYYVTLAAMQSIIIHAVYVLVLLQLGNPIHILQILPTSVM